MKKYYHAYDERYKTIHKRGFSWSSDQRTPIVEEVVNKFNINKDSSILEIGCGEGRDAIYLLNKGYNLVAFDVSNEAINYCKEKYSKFKDRFITLDFINDSYNKSFDYIYAVAVLHMLVEDEDRKSFYQFIYNHLNKNGIALITSMGDGTKEMKSNPTKAFDIVKREHNSGDIYVTSTSCRMVNFATLSKEISDNNLEILDQGITESLPDFDKLMFFVVKKHK